MAIVQNICGYGPRICLHAGFQADERSAKCRMLAPGDLNRFVSNIDRGLRDGHSSAVNPNQFFVAERTSYKICGQQDSSFDDLPVEWCGPHLTVYRPFEPVFMGGIAGVGKTGLRSPPG